MATHAPFARFPHYLCKFSEASNIDFKKGFGECVEIGESPKISKKSILVNVSTRQNWTFFVEYLHSQHLGASGHVLLSRQTFRTC